MEENCDWNCNCTAGSRDSLLDSSITSGAWEKNVLEGNSSSSEDHQRRRTKWLGSIIVDFICHAVVVVVDSPELHIVSQSYPWGWGLFFLLCWNLLFFRVFFCLILLAQTLFFPFRRFIPSPRLVHNLAEREESERYFYKNLLLPLRVVDSHDWGAAKEKEEEKKIRQRENSSRNRPTRRLCAWARRRRRRRSEWKKNVKPQFEKFEALSLGPCVDVSSLSPFSIEEHSINLKSREV